ncbi:MAG: DNA-protecting protein DprA [Candidatus Omnitrophica bacterium]|nr:DNA-protecting protein DprA [Candidatus Omnitrophota bacterium]
MPDLIEEELKALITLSRYGGGRRNISRIQEGILPSEILKMNQSESLFEESSGFNAEREIELCQKKGIRFLTWFDPDYPALLREIADPPLVLYMMGNLFESDEAAVAIVGSRHPSFYGISQARKFSRELARQGLTILSGFARGIDHEAHAGAMEIPYGRTIAVLGSGMDVIYPKEHGKLFDQIKERGAILTEYALGTSPLAQNFPRRNRIISGLSLGVLVVEAHLRSGSLITAHEALEHGREVFAIPGPVDQLTSRGTHRLIKQGAALVENSSEILEELAERLWPILGSYQKSIEETIEKKEKVEISQTEESDEEKIILQSLMQKPLPYEEILSISPGRPGTAMALLMKLELKKKIRRNRDGSFAVV